MLKTRISANHKILEDGIIILFDTERNDGRDLTILTSDFHKINVKITDVVFGWHRPKFSWYTDPYMYNSYPTGHHNDPSSFYVHWEYNFISGHPDPVKTLKMKGAKDLTMYNYDYQFPFLYRRPHINTLLRLKLYPHPFIYLYDMLMHYVVQDITNIIMNMLLKLYVEDNKKYTIK